MNNRLYWILIFNLITIELINLFSENNFKKEIGGLFAIYTVMIGLTIFLNDFTLRGKK